MKTHIVFSAFLLALMCGIGAAQELKASATVNDFIARERQIKAETQEEYGKQSIAGMTIKQLSEGSIFAIRHLRLGKTAKGLSGETLEGKMVRIEDYRGKALLIDFWATWCPPCVSAVPDLQELSRELPASQFAIIGISADQDEEKLRRFVKNSGIQWDNIVDRNSILQKRWQSLSLPTYYVLDEKGVVRFRGINHFAAAQAARSIVGANANVGGSAVPVDQIVKSIFGAFDTDKDGRIVQSEMPKEMKAQFELADLNKDGALLVDEVTRFLKEGKVTTEEVEATPTPQKGDRTSE